MKTTIVSITPDVANAYLLLNSRNRKVRKTHVTKLAGAMTRGEWELTHQGIAISADGSIDDGQHRLLAVVESGCAVNMMVTSGLPVGAFKHIDKGISRTNSDSTGFSKAHVEVLTFFMVAGGAKSATSNQILHMDLLIGDHVRALHDFCNTSCKMSSRVGVKSAAVLHSIMGNQEYAFSLYRDLVLNKIDGLPPIAVEFVRQRLKGSVIGSASGGGLAQQIVFTKCVALFDPLNKMSKRLLYTDDKRAGAILKMNAAISHIQARL